MSNIIETLVVKIASDITEFENGISSALKGTAEFEQAVNKIGNVGEGISKIGDKISDVGKDLTTKLTVPILGLGAAAMKIGNDFEAQMDRVSAIAGATGDDFVLLQNQAIALGADTSFSATEAAEGMESLASAGFTTKEIMAAMPGLLDLAASSGSELGVASEIVASTLRGFGLDAEQAAHVADVFALAAARTNAQTEDMGEAMKYAAPVAKAMGQSLEETAAAIGIMSDAGIKGSQAGTTLRGALTRLVKPTKPMIEVMNEMGISFHDTEGKMKPLNQMIAELQDKTSDYTQEQKNNALAVLFGQEALSGMLAMVDRGPEALVGLTEELKNSDGAAKAMADTMLDNTKGSIEAMMGSLETAAILIQQILAQAVQKGADFIANLANKFVGLDEGTKKFILTIVGIIAAIGPGVFGIGKLTSGVGSMITGFSKLSSLSPLFSKIGLAIGGISAPVLAVIAAIAALVAIFVGLYNTNEEFRTKIQAIWAEIQVFLAAAFAAIQEVAMTIFNALKEFWDTWGADIMAALSAIWDGIGVAFNLALDGLILVATTIFNALSEFWNTWGADIMAALSSIWNTLTKVFSTVIGTIITIATEIFNAVKEFWDTWGKDITDAFMGVFNALKDFFTTVFQGVWDIIKSIFDNIKAFWDEWGGRDFGNFQRSV